MVSPNESLKKFTNTLRVQFPGESLQKLSIKYIEQLPIKCLDEFRQESLKKPATYPSTNSLRIYEEISRRICEEIYDEITGEFPMEFLNKALKEPLEGSCNAFIENFPLNPKRYFPKKTLGNSTDFWKNLGEIPD